MSYNGYLKPYEDQIRQFYAEGYQPIEIATAITRKFFRSSYEMPWRDERQLARYEKEEIRRVYGVIRHMLGLNRKKIRTPLHFWAEPVDSANNRDRP